MVARATRQFIEVLGNGTGGVRVTQQFVEVLAPATQTYFEDLEDTLNLVQDAHLTEVHESVTSNIVFTQNAVTAVVLEKELSSTITFIQKAGQTFSETLESEMSLSEIVSESLVVGDHLGMHDTLAFTQDIEFAAGLFNVMETEMVLSQDVEVRGPIYKTFWTRIHLYDSAIITNWDQNQILEDTIEFIHTAGRNYDVDASTTMSLVQEMYRKQTPYNTLSLVQTLDWGKFPSLATQDLGLTQLAEHNGEWPRNVVDSLGIGHIFTYYIASSCITKDYLPAIGESSFADNPTPPNPSLPKIQGSPENERFLMFYPAVGTTTNSVELRAPNLDNRDRQSFTRINRETRGGKLSVFADPTWPKIHTLVLSFSGLTQTEVDDVQDFILTYLGKEIGLYDWEGRRWAGIITTPGEQAVHDSKAGFTLNFEFEGVLTDDMPSDNGMNMTDSATYNVDRTPELSDSLNLSDEVQETVESP